MSSCLLPSGNPAPSIANNPFANLINGAVHDLFTNAIDALLVNCACTTPCRFYYGNCKFVECTNCQGGIYKPGAPFYFPRGKVCPICNGKPHYSVESTEEIALMVIFDHRDFTVLGGVNKTNNLAETMCRIELYNKIMAAEKVVLDTCNECYTSNVYKRITKPKLCGLGRQEYIITGWEMIS